MEYSGDVRELTLGKPVNREHTRILENKSHSNGKKEGGLRDVVRNEVESSRRATSESSIN